MLNAMRDGKQSVVIKVILFGLLGLALMGLVLLDVSGVFDAVSGNTRLAKIGNIALTEQGFRRIYENELQTMNLNEGFARSVGLPNLIFDREIDTISTVVGARRSDLRISDAYIGNDMRTQLKAAGIAESEIADVFNRRLQQLGMSEQAFADDYRNNALRGIVTEAISTPSMVPLAIVDALYTMAMHQRKIDYVHIPLAELKDIDTLDDAALQAFYDDNITAYTAPPTRDILLSEVTMDHIESMITIDESDVLYAYENNKLRFTDPAMLEVERVIAENQDAAMAAVKSGKNGDDWAVNPPAGVHYVAPGKFSPESLPPSVKESFADAEIGTVTDPVDTDFGWQVFRLVERHPAKTRPLSEVRTQIETEMRAQLLQTTLFELGNTLEDRFAAGDSLETVAKEYQLNVDRYDNVSEDGQIGSGDFLRDRISMDRAEIILEAANAYDQPEIAPLIEMPGYGYIIVAIDAVTPATPKPFEQIKSQVKADYMAQKRRQRGMEIAANIETGASEKTQDAFEKAATSNGYDAKRSEFFSREKQGDRVLTPESLKAAFELKAIGDMNISVSDRAVQIIRLDGVRAPKIDRDSEGYIGVKSELEQAYLADSRQSFALHWRQVVDADIYEQKFTNIFLTQTEE